MKKFWKIKNVSNKQIKISVAISNTNAPGLFLQPNQFCVALAQLTAPLDKQIKCGYITVEEYDNSHNLELAKAFDYSKIDEIKEKTTNYAS